MRRTKEEAAQTKQALLDAALAVFSQNGYEAARLQDIAESAGATRGAIYHHYQNKAGLYTALLKEASDQGIVAIQEAIDEGGAFNEVCRRILINTFQLLGEDTRFQQITALSLYKSGSSLELTQEFEAEQKQRTEAIIAGIADLFQEGINAGILRRDIPAAVMARSFFAAQNGLMMLWLQNPDLFSIVTEAPTLAEIIVCGIELQLGLTQKPSITGD